MPPNRGLADKKYAGIKSRKVRLTYALTVNADGSEKLEPFVIGKAVKPWAFKRKTGEQLGFYYCNNAKAWMTGNLYQEWIKKWDRELVAKGHKILLVQDNFSGHIVPEGLQNIRVINFEPNLTAHVQPNDQGIIQCFKALYRASYILRAIDQYDTGVTPSNIYDINQLEAMRLADTAWREVDATTIRNCWRKSGILPPTLATEPVSTPLLPISSLIHDSTTQTDPVAHAERQVEQALNSLVATGALQTTNHMSIEVLLNPPAESQMMDKVTDQEIYQAVMEAREAHENMEMTGGDDIDEDCTVEPSPTRQQVLEAMHTIRRYTDELDGPIAHCSDLIQLPAPSGQSTNS